MASVGPSERPLPLRWFMRLAHKGPSKSMRILFIRLLIFLYRMSKLPPEIIQNDGEFLFPSIGSMYDFFTPRTKDIRVWSVGFQYGGFEAHIAESTGAKIHIFDSRPEAKERWTIFQRVMNEHEVQEDDPSWAEPLTNQWILPDSTQFQEQIPYEFTGTLMIKNDPITLQEATDEKVDICKVDYKGFTNNFLYSLLNKGYRPGLLYVHWDGHPDECAHAMLCAGHLQNCGYRLLNSVKNYFLYLFVDENMYEICSWNDKSSANPMFEEYRKQIFNLTVELANSINKTS